MKRYFWLVALALCAVARADGVNVFQDPVFIKATAKLPVRERNIAAAELYIRMHDYASATPLLRAAAEQENKAELWDLLAFSCNREGAWQDGFEAANKAIALKPKKSFGYGERGIAGYQQGNYATAEKDLAQYLRSNRSDGLAQYYHGLALARQGRMIEGRASLLQARLYSPGLTALATTAIAQIDADSGHFAEALGGLRELNEALAEDDSAFARTVEQELGEVKRAQAVRRGELGVRNEVLRADVARAGNGG